MTPRLPLLLLALTSLLFSARNAMGAEKGITLRLLVCEVTKEPVKVFLQTKAAKSDMIDLSSSALSESMAVSARSVNVRAPDTDEPLCHIKLPAEGKAFAVILAPEEPTGFVPIVVRLDDDSFISGDFHFINRSAKTVVLKLGGTEVEIKAGDSAKSRPTEPVNNRYYNITMSDRVDAVEKVFASTRWPMENSNRAFIIFSSKANGRTIYRAVDE